MIQYICDLCGASMPEEEAIYGVRIVPRKGDVLLSDEIQELDICGKCWKSVMKTGK